MTSYMRNKKIRCDCCGKFFDTDGVHKGRIRKDGTVAMCKTCNWISRHGGLPLSEGFTSNQARYALEFILTAKSLYLNDLAEDMGISLEDAIRLVNCINVKGKKYTVKYNCDYCGKECAESSSVYLQNKHSYCSSECYWKHKREIAERGKDSILYNRIKTKCTNCNRDIYVKPYQYNETNSYGDNHNFCSQECYWKYRSKYYVKDKASRFDSSLSEELKERMRRGFIEWSKSSDRFDSKIQITINNILDSLHIRYEREHQIKYYAIDNFLIDSGLMVEVMGDYWHVSPIKYASYSLLNDVQKRDVAKDKAKHTYIKNKYDIEPLYLWENDIENNPDVCIALILKYVENNGMLDDYQSFNWTYDGVNLKLNDDIIIPYQNIDINECYCDVL